MNSILSSRARTVTGLWQLALLGACLMGIFAYQSNVKNQERKQQQVELQEAQAMSKNFATFQRRVERSDLIVSLRPLADGVPNHLVVRIKRVSKTLPQETRIRIRDNWSRTWADIVAKNPAGKSQPGFETIDPDYFDISSKR